MLKRSSSCLHMLLPALKGQNRKAKPHYAWLPIRQVNNFKVVYHGISWHTMTYHVAPVPPGETPPQKTDRE